MDGTCYLGRREGRASAWLVKGQRMEALSLRTGLLFLDNHKRQRGEVERFPCLFLPMQTGIHAVTSQPMRPYREANLGRVAKLFRCGGRYGPFRQRWSRRVPHLSLRSIGTYQGLALRLRHLELQFCTHCNRTFLSPRKCNTSHGRFAACVRLTMDALSV